MSENGQPYLGIDIFPLPSSRFHLPTSIFLLTAYRFPQFNNYKTRQFSIIFAVVPIFYSYLYYFAVHNFLNIFFQKKAGDLILPYLCFPVTHKCMLADNFIQNHVQQFPFEEKVVYLSDGSHRLFLCFFSSKSNSHD